MNYRFNKSLFKVSRLSSSPACTSVSFSSTPHCFPLPPPSFPPSTLPLTSLLPVLRLISSIKALFIWAVPGRYAHHTRNSNAPGIRSFLLITSPSLLLSSLSLCVFLPPLFVSPLLLYSSPGFSFEHILRPSPPPPPVSLRVRSAVAPALWRKSRLVIDKLDFFQNTRTFSCLSLLHVFQTWVCSHV